MAALPEQRDDDGEGAVSVIVGQGKSLMIAIP
jgi:hypothetical protein